MFYTEDFNVPNFSEKQISRQAKKQYDFLSIIYPFLFDNVEGETCIEIRAINRNDDLPFLKSLNLFRLDDLSFNSLKKFLKNVNGKPICLYYSAFCLNYSLSVKKPDGKKYNKGQINNINSMFTAILPMDFDNISEDDYYYFNSILEDLDIETINIFTGHGYQNIILLNEKIYDKDIFKKFTYLLLSKGFPVDSKIIDSARVLRLPHSFNCKEYSSKFKSDIEPTAIPVKRINTTYRRYSCNKIFELIRSLKTVNTEYELKYNESLNKSDDKLLPESKINDIKLIPLREEYKILNFDLLPEAIKNMLAQTPKGYRNSVILFLVPFLRNKLGLSFDNIISVMIIWGKRCNPALSSDFVETEVKRIYSYNNKSYGVYSSELSQMFGYIDFKEYDKYELDNKVIIPNQFFSHYDVLSDGAVLIFLMMKLFEKTENIKKWETEMIIDYCNINRATFYRNINDLIKFGFIDKKRNIKKFGDKYIFYINKFYDKSLGFTLFNTSTLRMMVYDKHISLTKGEIKAYTYMIKMINNNPTETCFASQQTLGEFIGKDRSTLSKITNSLNKKNYIKKDNYKDREGIEHCTYTLIY